MDHAHRIGQTKQVYIFHFITEDSVEERMLQQLLHPKYVIPFVFLMYSHLTVSSTSTDSILTSLPVLLSMHATLNFPPLYLQRHSPMLTPYISSHSLHLPELPLTCGSSDQMPRCDVAPMNCGNVLPRSCVVQLSIETDYWELEYHSSHCGAMKSSIKSLKLIS